MKTLKRSTVFYAIFFALLWIYVIFRALNIYYVHDELVSKWSYMIDWNPWPYKGYVDANNQFLTSLLGGAFIRLFNSDSAFVIRLPSVLAFPLYFYALYGFKKYFKNQFAFLLFLISMSASPFILEFFSLARGYALAWTFLMLSLLQLFSLVQTKRIKYFYTLLLFSLIGIYANLSVLVLILAIVGFGFIYMLYVSNTKHRVYGSISFIFTAAFIGYFIQYGFNLQKIGKLYLGSSNNFYNTSIHPLIQLNWGVEGLWASVFIGITSIVTIFFYFSHFKKSKSLLQLSNVFIVLLICMLLGTFLMQLIFGVNYPENRAAVPLLILAMGAFAFGLDLKKHQFFSILFSLLCLGLYASNYNLSHTKTYQYEYINRKLIDLIPDQVYGIPTATGGRHWATDKVYNRELKDYPPRFFQKSLSSADTLQDFILVLPEDRDNLLNAYDILAVDEISNLRLYKRKKFLKRKIKFSKTYHINTNNEFYNLIYKQTSQSAYVRCQGYLIMNDLRDMVGIVYDQSDSLSNKLNYGSFSPVKSIKVDSENKLNFDITFTFLDLENAKNMSLYLWNSDKVKMKGELIVTFYEIEN